MTMFSSLCRGGGEFVVTPLCKDDAAFSRCRCIVCTKETKKYQCFNCFGSEKYIYLSYPHQ